MTQPCPLCLHPETHPFYSDADRDYLRCTQCALIFVSRADLLSAQEEKARYDLHENNPDDTGYRHFLSQLINPLLSKLDPPPLTGLDFGSGPGPTLSVMLEEQGYRIKLYDPFYAPHVENLKQTYDFVTCTETLEHFNNPKKEWDLLIKLVKPGGWLGLMTWMIDDLENFSQWHYIKDRTHVNFFSRSTFRFLASGSGLSVDFIGDNVILMNKQKLGHPLIKWIAMPPHSRLKRERKTVRKIIALYCHAHHGNTTGQLCPDCQSLADYADQRILHCPYNPNKPTCANCPVHCYQSDRREQIRQVMRFSGPRMLIYHPRLALLHLIDDLRKPPER